MIDLQSLNQHVTLHHFKVEEIKLVKGLIQRGNLDGEVGLKRRLSVGPNSPTSPEVPQVQV